MCTYRTTYRSRPQIPLSRSSPSSMPAYREMYGPRSPSLALRTRRGSCERRPRRVQAQRLALQPAKSSVDASPRLPERSLRLRLPCHPRSVSRHRQRTRSAHLQVSRSHVAVCHRPRIYVIAMSSRAHPPSPTLGPLRSCPFLPNPAQIVSSLQPTQVSLLMRNRATRHSSPGRHLCVHALRSVRGSLVTGICLYHLPDDRARVWKSAPSNVCYLQNSIPADGVSRPTARPRPFSDRSHTQHPPGARGRERGRLLPPPLHSDRFRGFLRGASDAISVSLALTDTGDSPCSYVPQALPLSMLVTMRSTTCCCGPRRRNSNSVACAHAESESAFSNSLSNENAGACFMIDTA
ncbi:uncharacterized protein B0H18DRAFT_286638 [Fomitopsis serialis]|uniref:uncharacterized protein n=1 Tax=Fomitopsis serialis TaxID=139415 RepID=UPI002007CD3F|nr:uncharacterized protein B0H18DRAFT_286638 [Neoantrodia serialis]KAH9911991.1 hypothetical protein B0H18DRAFT_286638 [Neoantrodia serialis]